MERKYPEHLMESELTKVDDNKGENHVFSERHRKKDDSSVRVPMVLTYLSFLPDIRKFSEANVMFF